MAWAEGVLLARIRERIANRSAMFLSEESLVLKPTYGFQVRNLIEVGPINVIQGV